ncbi:MAG: adenosylhomocysteinase [Granulosicoccus sp.]
MSSQAPFHPDFLGEMCRRLALKPYPDTRQFVVQHLFPDTVRLLALLHRYVPIDTVIGISYSGNTESIRKLRDMGIRVLTPAYSDLNDCVAKELQESISRCADNNHRLIIHEVGGIAIKALHEPEFIGENVVVGVLEITKQGVWVAEQLTELKVPQINVAQTRLKEIEGKQVGEAVAAALDSILRELGYSTVGRDALVIGYGWVGKGIAQSLRNRGLGVGVKDVDMVSVVEATVDGHHPCYTDTLSRSPAIVVGATGKQSINKNLISQLPDRCFLASGSSKDHEIDLPFLASETESSVQLHQHVRQCTLHDGRRLYLINEGYPVNFTGASVPDEIVEFLFAELIMLIPRLLENTVLPGIHTLPEIDEALPASIWLEMR